MTDATEAVEAFQMSVDAAEVYEKKFVPAMFAEWAPHLCDAAELQPGQRVLDVACGTGIAARAAAPRVQPKGSVTGVDLNPAMLTVAGRVAPELTWRPGDAADLPFADKQFDVVLCQAALMFFPDPVAALAEMARVVTPDGTVAVQVWGTLESSIGYARLVKVAARHAGPEAVSLLGAYWVHGNLDETSRLFESAGLEVATVTSRLGAATFDSIADCVNTEFDATPLGERIDDEIRSQILADADTEMAEFLSPTGVDVPIHGHLIVARKH